MLNNEQAKYLAELLKITAVAEFGYFGYRSLESPDHAMFYVAAFVFVLLAALGISVLSLVKKDEEKK
jgi:hypothetical protein